ncbi:GAF domain-containing protein [Nocardioides sp.]|uniref:GAF domain-containing sensor histidine kinase n=1 Tax=Nocardioides sp. TaxID=35761 RepID=UPI002605F8A2|nr:GAF domain-containing protein [Nocardioides sp.]
MSAQVNDLLHKIVRIAATSTGARYAAIGVIADLAEAPTRLATFITYGLTEAEKRRLETPPSGRGMLGALIDAPVPVRVSEMSRDPRSAGLPPGHPPMRTLLGVPIRIGEEVFGNLYLTEKEGGGDFTETDEAVAVALASAVGVAVDRLWHQWRVGVERVATAAVHRERDRISRDLHDVVVQRLFAGGMELKRDIGLVGDDAVAARLDGVVDELDGVIRELRRTVFDLRRVGDSDDVQSEVTRLVARFESSLTFRPRVSFAGPVRWRVGPDLVAEVVAVVSEGLSNVARHAVATTAYVEVAIVGHDLVLRVADDGGGLPDGVRLSGLSNLAERARARGGDFRVGPREPRGTELVWQVPLL